MNTRLSHIHEWPELAEQANWSAATLAKMSGTSVRMLERYFQQNVGKPPKAWLTEQRQNQAIKLLRNGSSIKEAAAQLGYRYANHFSREFKMYWGFCPSVQKASNKPPTACRVFI
jgi:AraC-like DNA-binding protein